MSWLFSQALVEEYLVDTSSDGEQSVQSSGSHTQQAYCAPDKMTAFSRLSRFGMTYKPLTASRGEELLTLYRAGFRAKTLAQQGEATVWTENEAECGDTWRGWLAKYDPNSCLWKTAQCSLLEEEPESLQTLPRSGMTVNGLLWELPTLEPITRGTESGLLVNTPPPPPTHTMAYADSTHEQRNKRTERTQSEHTNIDCTSQLAHTGNEGYVWWLGCMGAIKNQHHNRGSQINGRGEWWQVEPRLARVADGVAARVDRLKAIGNGQVPLCAATAWQLLSK